METVLLTGANGFIGRHVPQHLTLRGARVLCVGRSAQRDGKRDASGIVPVACDWLDSGAVADLFEQWRPTHWLHLAWVTEHGRFWNAHENLDWTASTLRALRHFHEAGGERVVMAGTCAEYAPDGERCDERTTPTVPATLYAASKLATCELLERFAGESGISWAWGRIFYPYGPGEPEGRFLPSVFRALLRSETLACSHGRQRRDFLFVEDVAEAFAALLASQLEGRINIASGEAVTLREVAEHVAKLCDAPAERIEFGALPTREDEPLSLVAEVGRLRDELGWRPRFDLDEGLERCLHYGRSRWQAA